MQLAIQRQTKENQLAIKKSFCRNAKLRFKRTQRTKPNYLKTSKTQREEQKPQNINHQVLKLKTHRLYI